MVDLSILKHEEIANLTFDQIQEIRANLYKKDKYLYIVLSVPIYSNIKCDILKIIAVPNHRNYEIINVEENVLNCNNKIFINNEKNDNFKIPEKKCYQEIIKN